MRLFYGHEAVHAGPGRGVIVFAAGRCGVDGQARILPSGQDDRASRGKSADDGECYNPTLSCANRYFMLFRMSRGSNPVLPEAQRGGNREGKNFFIWIRCNPLKSPEFRQRNPRKCKLFCLVLFGFAWIYLAAKPNSRQRALSLSDLGAEPDNRVKRRLRLVELRRVAAGFENEALARARGSGPRWRGPASRVPYWSSAP